MRTRTLYKGQNEQEDYRVSDRGLNSWYLARGLPTGFRRMGFIQGFREGFQNPQPEETLVSVGEGGSGTSYFLQRMLLRVLNKGFHTGFQ